MKEINGKPSKSSNYETFSSIDDQNSVYHRQEVQLEIEQMMKSYRERVGVQEAGSSSSEDESDDDTEFDPIKKSKIRKSQSALQKSYSE